MANLYNVPLKNSVQHTLAGTLTQAETGTITLDSSVTAELQATSTMKGILVVDRVDVNGNLTPTKTEYISFSGVSGSTVTGLTRGLGGTSAQGHAIGAIVEFVPDVTWGQAINDVITNQHNSDGTHKTLSLLSLVSVTINNATLNNYVGFAASLTSLNVQNLYANTAVLLGASLASSTLTNRTYIQATSRSRSYVSNASTTYLISIQNANFHELYLNGTSKSLGVIDVFADTSMTSPFITKVIYGGTCSLTFQNTINWAGGIAPTQTSTTGKADYFGFIPSTASVFDGFVVGSNVTA